MPRLTITRLAAAAPMGQQVYEEEISRRAEQALGREWDVRNEVVRTLRSPLPGTARLPYATLARPGPARRVAGAFLARHGGVVHRMDLRLPPSGLREVLTIHDVVAWRFPDEASVPRSVYDEARAAARIICPSQFSADEVQRVLGVAAPTVIHNGVDDRFFGAEPADERRLEELGIRPPFVLHAGGCSLRKNLPALAEAWPTIADRHRQAQLVLVGPPAEERDRLFAALNRVRIVGRLRFDDLLGVMAAASAVVVPSRYEGFGIPALEGMAAGVPVVAANRSSLPEVCADAAVLVEPSAAGIAEGVSHVLESGPEVAALVERGKQRATSFTWDASARAHADVWRAVAAG